MDINEFDAWMTQAKLYAGLVEPIDRPKVPFYLKIIEGSMDIFAEENFSPDIEGIL